MDGHQWRVAYVNPSRAHCVSIARVPITITDRQTGDVRSFLVRRVITIDITAHTNIELLAELERNAS